MPISEAANKNHEELFPNQKSTLKETDPEFIELFDNWAFDEVISHGDLDTKTRVMLILAALIASQALGEYKVMVGAALTVGVTPVEIKEIVTFSFILSLGGCEPQLKGNIQGNLNIGNDKQALLNVVTQLLPYVGYPRTLNTIRCLNEVVPED